MAYTLDFSLALGSGKAGLTLVAQLVDSDGNNVGSAIMSGFTEIGNGNYLWHCETIPDGHRGGVKFYESGAPGTVLAFAAINPEEGEYTDTKTSTRATQSDILADATPFNGADIAAILDDTGTSGVKVADKTGYRLSATGVDDILDEAVEGSYTLRQLLRLMAAVLAGKSSGGGTTTITFRNLEDDTNRVVATVDSSGNRTSVTLDLS